MTQKSETPLMRGVSRNSCGCCFREDDTPINHQKQFLSTHYNISSRFAGIIVELVFGGGDRHV